MHLTLKRFEAQGVGRFGGVELGVGHPLGDRGRRYGVGSSQRENQDGDKNWTVRKRFSSSSSSSSSSSKQ